MEKKPRAKERVQLITGVLRVTLFDNEAGMIDGDVCNVSACGAGIHILPDKLPSLNVGQETVLSFHRPGARQHVTTRAVLRHSVALQGAMHYGFEFVQPEKIRNQLKGGERVQLCSLFNARGSSRVDLDSTNPLMTMLETEDGTVHSLMRVVNLSSSGMAVQHEGELVAALAGVQRVKVTFPNPMDGKPISFQCTPRGSRSAGAHHHLGLEFDAERTQGFEPKRKSIQEYCEELQRSYLDQASG